MRGTYELFYRTEGSWDKLRVEQSDKGKVSVLKIYGRLVGGPDSDYFRELIASLIDDGRKKVVVDLARVGWINSTGMGILLSAQSVLRRHAGDLKLANVSSRIRNILYVTKLNLIFECYDSVEKAIESF